MNKILLFFVLLSFSASAQVSYNTTCSLLNGRAHGTVNSFGNSLSIGGYTFFYFFDTTGTQIGSESVYANDYISTNSNKEIASANYPAQACSCTYVVNAAVKELNTLQNNMSAIVNVGNARLSTTCEVRNGNAYGSVNNYGESFEINGNVKFYLFDCNGKLLQSKDEFEYEYVSPRTSEEIEHTSAPSEACKCLFDVKEAVVVPASSSSSTATSSQGVSPVEISSSDVVSVSDKIKYNTSCSVKNGNAYGTVNNLDEAFEINGKVLFYLFDCNGKLIKTEDEYEYEYVSARSTEEVEYTYAPSEACKCSFDVKSAIVVPASAKTSTTTSSSSTTSSTTTSSTTTSSSAPASNTSSSSASQPEIRYTPSCEVRNGRAYGSVTNLNESFEINGTVTFYLYDCNGQLVGTDNVYEYEYVNRKSTEDVDDIPVFTKVCSCSFDVAKAVKK